MFNGEKELESCVRSSNKFFERNLTYSTSHLDHPKPNSQSFLTYPQQVLQESNKYTDYSLTNITIVSFIIPH